MLKLRKSNLVYLAVVIATIIICTILYNEVVSYYSNDFEIRMIIFIRIIIFFVFGFVLGLDRLFAHNSINGKWLVQLEFLAPAILLFFTSLLRVFLSDTIGTISLISINSIGLLTLLIEILTGYLVCISFVKENDNSDQYKILEEDKL